MNKQDLINLHDSFKQDVNEKTWDQVRKNRKYKASLPRDNKASFAYCEGYEQALVDIQNWLVTYLNPKLDGKL